MKVLQINIFGNLSTGKIAVDIYHTLIDAGFEGAVAYARNTIESGVPEIKIGSKKNVILDGVLTRLTDRAGFFSRKATIELIAKIEEYKPDIIHLHNLHGYYINVEILFDYLKKSKIPVVWTLHDCWSFTGHCCHFYAIGCDKWKTGCGECPQISSYPASLVFDNSKKNYHDKFSLFTSLDSMTIVTVSKWLEKVTGQSFMNKYPIVTIYNGIDLHKFHPVKSTVRDKLKISYKKMILGVASTWAPNKRLCDFLELSTIISSEYVIVLVGLDAKQIASLPKNIIGMGRTNGLEELVELYSTADIFFNASIEETFGLPTVEAMACGTPVVVYNSTALPEVVESGCGYIVEPKNVAEVWKSILNICEKHDYSKAALSENAKKYECNQQFSKYIELYKRVTL